MIELDTLLDTVSPVSLVKLSHIPSDSINDADNNADRFRGINSSGLILLGALELDINLEGRICKNVRLLVVPDYTMSAAVVLGRDLLKKLGLGLRGVFNSESRAIHEILNIDVSCPSGWEENIDVNFELCYDIRRRLQELFRVKYLNGGLQSQGRIKGEIVLNVSSSEPFPFQSRRLSYAEKNEVRVILESWLKAGIIRPSQSEYASPIVLIRKKNGEICLWIDYRRLNKVTFRDNYPLPFIEHQLEALGGKRYFTKFDLKGGFRHVDVNKDSIKYTSFVTPLGQYEFVEMPFGLKGAPSAFERWIHRVLEDFIRRGELMVYLDDFLMTTDSTEEHFRILNAWLPVLAENTLQLRIDKCKFVYTEMEFLGYHIKAGIQPTRDGVDAV